MKYFGVRTLVDRKTFRAAFTLLTVILAGGSASTVSAQSQGDWAINQAQRAVRQRIISHEGGRGATVLFNSDPQTVFRSRTQVRVRGTGSFSRNNNDSRYHNARNNDRRHDDSRNNDWRSRDFSYEAIVDIRNRYANVSGVKYDWRGDWSGNGGRNNGRGNGDDYDGRGNSGGSYGADNRPNGRVIYSGPIMNRHSDKGLDVTERSNRDGANIQQWSYADQPNQNWDVIDLGNGESAIISRQSGRALSVRGGRDNNGANVIQQSWTGSPQQLWRLEQIGNGYYRIVSVDNGKCLDVTQEGKQDGANVQLWDYANQSNQQWRLRR